MVDIVVAVIEAVYSFLWDDLITVPLPGGGTIGFSLLVKMCIRDRCWSCSVYGGSEAPFSSRRFSR